ncbi:MAG: hypothetical protein ABIT71_08365 [Vicinamibacteraceae bacterium]
MSGTSQGFGEHGAFTVSVGGDPRLADTVHELTRKTAEMSGCSPADAVSLAEAACAVASDLAEDLDLAYRPEPTALVLEVRTARRGKGGRSLHAVLSRDTLAKVKALVPGAELQGSGADECCFLTCPRSAPPA